MEVSGCLRLNFESDSELGYFHQEHGNLLYGQAL